MQLQEISLFRQAAIFNCSPRINRRRMAQRRDITGKPVMPLQTFNEKYALSLEWILKKPCYTNDEQRYI